MDDLYFLRSARLGFRWWTPEDRSLAEQLWGDPEVVRYIGGCDPAKVAERLERHLGFAREGGVQYWPLFLLVNHDFVGCCGLRPPQDGACEIGLHLRPPFWHNGYGVEASQAVIAYAFDTVGAAAVTAEVHPGHAASQRLLEKLGFHRDGEKLHERSGIVHYVYRLPRPA